MKDAALITRRLVLRLHRWLGAAFALVFLAWFVSGMVLMYCPFPGVTERDRWERAEPLDPAQVRIAPEQAIQGLAAGGIPSEIRLHVLDGRPVYRISIGGRTRLVFADSGQSPAEVTQAVALRVAARWVRLPPATATFVRRLTKADQWTVSLAPDQFPAWRFGWPTGEEVYVSQPGGEVIQYTTRSGRVGAYFGAIPHWFYFASLRRHAAGWSRTVICLAALGLLTAVLGLGGGVWIYALCRRVPYLGMKRWHVALGLIFGTVTVTWVFSGLLSMGPFTWLKDAAATDLNAALHGKNLDVARFAAKPPRAALEEASLNPHVKELAFDSFDGEAVYLATESPRKSLIIPMDRPPQPGFNAARIAQAVTRAAAPARVLEARTVTHYESYYLDRQNLLPLPVLSVRLDDAVQSRAYLDFRTGRVVQSYGTRARVERWLYHGLHSMDFPWLYAHRPLWDALVAALMLGGIMLSFTSLVLAFRMVSGGFRRGYRSATHR